MALRQMAQQMGLNPIDRVMRGGTPRVDEFRQGGRARDPRDREFGEEEPGGFQPRTPAPARGGPMPISDVGPGGGGLTLGNDILTPGGGGQPPATGGNPSPFGGAFSGLRQLGGPTPLDFLPQNQIRQTPAQVPQGGGLSPVDRAFGLRRRQQQRPRRL